MYDPILLIIPLCLFMTLDNFGQDDARIVNETTLIIAPQTDTGCIAIEAVDDEIAEGNELFNLTAMANNTLDSVNGTTSIEIPANDGMISHKCSK